MTTAQDTLPPEEREHRRALAALTNAIRRLCDASVSTRVAPEVLERSTREIDEIRHRLESEQHDGPYSGLMGRTPMRRAKASWRSGVRSWPRKNTTRCSSQAARMASTVS